MAAGLLLVTALHLDRLFDGLTIGNARVLQNGVGAELAGQLVADHVQVQLALTGKQRLGGFHVLFQLDGGVLLHEAGQAAEDLVFLALLGGEHGLADAGGGILNGRILDGVGRIAQGVAGVGEL